VSIILARFQSGSKLSPRYLFCNTIYGTYDPALLPNFTGVLMKRGNRARISRLSSRATRPGCKLANYQHLKYGLPATNSLFSSTWILCLYKRKKAMGIGDRGSRTGGLEKATNRHTHFDLSFWQRQCTLWCILRWGMGIHTCPLLNARTIPLWKRYTPLFYTSLLGQCICIFFSGHRH